MKGRFRGFRLHRRTISLGGGKEIRLKQTLDNDEPGIDLIVRVEDDMTAMRDTSVTVSIRPSQAQRLIKELEELCLFKRKKSSKR